MRGCMSKQRHLLTLIILLSTGMLFAGIQWDSSGNTVIRDNSTFGQVKSTFLGEFNAPGGWSLTLDSRLKASNYYIDQFPQSKYLNTALSAKFKAKHIHATGIYRNTLYGDPQRLNLYPLWDQGAFDYRNRHQHQCILAVGTDLSPVKADMYLIGKALYSTPTEYVFDPETFEITPMERPLKSHEDVYSGAAISVTPLPELQLSAGADFKQANFDASDLYSVNSLNLQAASEINLLSNTQISGIALWQSRQGDNLPLETRNLFTGQLRLQQRISNQMNGFISFISNTCADSKLDNLYLISNQVRAQVKYTALYDDTQDSYLLLGGKFSPQHDANALFAEAQSQIITGLYTSAGITYQPDLPDLYQGKISWYYTPVSTLYLSYFKTIPGSGRKDYHLLGIGTNFVY